MRASRLLRGFLLTCGLLLTAACSAHNDAGSSAAASAATAAATSAAKAVASLPFTAGNQYVNFKLPKGQATPTGSVVLIEVFSYGCPHCAEFAPYMDKLRAELPKNVEVRYMPAIFSREWVPYAQAFYAAKQLGVLKQTHDAFFKAMLEHYPLNSLQDMADFYARHGVNRQQFLAAATSAATTRQMNADLQTEFSWGVDATPTLVVGRLANDAQGAPFVALMRSADINSYAQLQQVGLWMVQHAEQH